MKSKLPDTEVASADALALPTRASRRLVEVRLAGLPSAKVKGSSRRYPLAAVLPALCKQPDSSSAERRILELRERESRAHADIAEMNLMAKAGKLCLLSDAKLFWSEGRIAIRQTIERAEFMTEPQKVKLLKRLAAMKQAMPPEAVTEA